MRSLRLPVRNGVRKAYAHRASARWRTCGEVSPVVEPERPTLPAMLRTTRQDCGRAGSLSAGISPLTDECADSISSTYAGACNSSHVPVPAVLRSCGVAVINFAKETFRDVGV
jgi:hypothetical protein